MTADLDLDQADTTVSGSSRLQLAGAANALSVAGSGGGTLELADLHLQDLDITLSGASHGRVQVDRTITAQVSGASKPTYKGTPQFPSEAHPALGASNPPRTTTRPSIRVGR